MNQESKDVIIQSNHLIEAHYRLTLQEKRLILWLIKEIKADDTDFKKYVFSITEFAHVMDFNVKTQYKEMRKVTKSLVTRLIEIHDAYEQDIIQMSWLCFVRWEIKKGTCSLQFHPELKPYLLQLKKQFTKIGFADLLGLKSVYSVRIFELLVQYEAIGKRKMELEDIKAWCGLDKNEYQLYAHLKTRVINRAKIEINDKTDYEVDYTEIKESRKVIAIEWTIKKKDKVQKEHLRKLEVIKNEYNSNRALIESFIEYGFSQAMARRLVKSHEESVLRNALRAVDLQVQKGHAKNPKAMLQTAIQEKWHPEIFRKGPKAKAAIF